MAKSKHTKKALLMSLLSVVLCLSMLIGSTFAWFTDSVTSGNNKIVAGNLDIDLEYATAFDDDGKPTEWKSVEGVDNLFNPDALWEPGHTEVVYLRITNKGTLALTYKLGVKFSNEKAGTNVAGESFKLSDYLVFKHVDNGANEITKYENREDAWTAAGTEKGLKDYAASATLLAGDTTYGALIIYMPTTVGNEANYRNPADFATLSLDPNAPYIELGVNLLATQAVYEKDSFNNEYDKDATYYAWDGESVDTDWYDDVQTVFDISTPEELAGLAELVNGGETFSGKTITLQDNIDLGGEAWTPIGTDANPFTGTFDGNGKTVSGVTATEETKSHIGLFGVLDSANVDDLTIRGAKITAFTYGGALAGKTKGSTITGVTIEDCEVEIVGSTGLNYTYGGIFAGQAYTGAISDCTIRNSHVTSGGNFVGGFSGIGYATFTNCTVDGCIIEGNAKIGGVVGQYDEGERTMTGVTVKNSTVRCGLAEAGMLIGTANYGSKTFENCTVENCTIEGGEGKARLNNVGGMVGTFSVTDRDPETTLSFVNCHVSGIHMKSDGLICNAGGIFGARYTTDSKTSGLSVTVKFENCSVEMGEITSATNNVYDVGAFAGRFRTSYSSTTTDLKENATFEFVGDNNTYSGWDVAVGGTTHTIIGTAVQK